MTQNINAMQMALLCAVTKGGVAKKVGRNRRVLMSPYPNSDGIVHSAVEIPFVEPA